MILARRSRSVSAWRAIARFMPSGKTTSFTSTEVTLIPHGPVCRSMINLTLQEIIDRQTGPWGIKVTSVEVKDVVLPDGMKRAMARQAETERERRAKIINAEGEFQAAEKLVQAAAMISEQPIALQLRYLQTMKEISSEHSTTTFLPIPIELFAPYIKGESG